MHTPGPWKVESVHNTREVLAPSGRTICRAHLDEATRTEAETLANAHLIAEAPELLDHLEYAVKLLRPFGHSAQVRAMHATIARARGEA